MIVEELGVTFPGSINLDGSVQFADILKDGMGFPAISNIPVFGLYQCINQSRRVRHESWPPRHRRECTRLTG